MMTLFQGTTLSKVYGIAKPALLFARLLTLMLLLSAWARADSFVFTAIPDQDESHLQQRFGKVATYLGKQLGVEVQYIPVKSYAAAITAFRNNQVQLAWFGGLSGVQARRLVPGSEALAQGYEDQFFKTYFIAHKSAGIEPADTLPAALKGKTFTFGSKGSTSGRLMPEFYLRQRFESKVQVIWITPTYPDYQWSIRGDVDQRFGKGFKTKVRTALLNMNNPELLATFPRKSFVPASNDDYAPIETTAKAIGVLDE
ncbi:MAG: PhnD/SsuA/transferrin family substrate-binding protein [Exilibacterium sp.]